MPKIFYVNNFGGGFADHIDVDEGTTVGQLFTQRMRHERPSEFLIRVNRQVCPSDQVLQEGDRVSITPTKIEGASL
jgi:sulfur carrier protein ThiS